MPPRVRSFVVSSHRWLGLTTAFVLAIVGVTGAILAFPQTTRLHRIVAPLHDALGIGRPGTLIVDTVTFAAIVLSVSGLYLWWRRKILTVRIDLGWPRMASDLHHALGVLNLAMILLLAATGLGMALARSVDFDEELRRIIIDLHTARAYPLPIKLVYVMSSTAFAIECLTGIVMWWRNRNR